MRYRVDVNVFRVPGIILGYIPICSILVLTAVSSVFFWGGGMRRPVCMYVCMYVGTVKVHMSHSRRP